MSFNNNPDKKILNFKIGDRLLYDIYEIVNKNNVWFIQPSKWVGNDNIKAGNMQYGDSIVTNGNGIIFEKSNRNMWSTDFNERKLLGIIGDFDTIMNSIDFFDFEDIHPSILSIILSKYPHSLDKLNQCDDLRNKYLEKVEKLVLTILN